jgi:hypothetical protein
MLLAIEKKLEVPMLSENDAMSDSGVRRRWVSTVFASLARENRRSVPGALADSSLSTSWAVLLLGTRAMIPR